MSKSAIARPRREPIVQTPAVAPVVQALDQNTTLPGYQNFTIPIPINRKAVITIPNEWTADDWDLFKSMLDVYISGWKQMAQQQAAAASHKDKGSTPQKE